MPRAEDPSRLIGLFAMLALLMLQWPGSLHGQAEPPPDTDPPGYAEATAQAVKEFAELHFEEAQALFQRAHELYPNARTYRGLALAEFELRDYVAAVGHFEAALTSSVKPLDAELRADTESMLARANDFVARVRIQTRPSGAQVTVDGIPVERDSGQPFLLQAGDHRLEVQAPGFVTQTRKLDVRGGQMLPLSVVLASAKRPWYKSPWLWGTLGAVALAAAGTSIALTTGGQTVHEQPNGGSADAVLVGPSQ